jgi:hypothetical protein
MAASDPASAAQPGDFPRVPAHAWSWLQRSRPVLAEASRRLTGGPPEPGFVESLRERFADDAFTRDVLVAVIADVAFKGRIPRRRPPGASWDRGLTWWAAAIAGMTPREFDAAGAAAVEQSRLFRVEEEEQAPPGPRPARRGGRSPERAMLISGLRDLLHRADGEAVPAAAVRQLLEQLEGPHSADRGPRQ